MKIIHVFGLVIAIGLTQVPLAHADDYDAGVAAGANGYYGGKPDNTSSADYTQGYSYGQSQQHQQQMQNSNDGE